MKKDWEKLHFNRIEGYKNQIEEIFNKATKEAALMGALFDEADLFSQSFNFKDYPQTKQRIDKLMTQVHSDIQTVVVNGATAEWKHSNLKNDELAKGILGIKNNDEIPEKFQKYFNNNNKALAAFLNRTEKGMNLSDRVWKYTEAFKQEIEIGLDMGIRAGKPAAEMARDLKKYLQEPDRLYRRVRDASGNLQLSKAARDYHPGRGVYRSSYKNAMRLTRTETNMAYRSADNERYQQLDFIVGYEVKLTNNPAHVVDICDDLKGKYPKTFKFVGWHPHCMCHVTTILKTPEELDKDIDNILEGQETDTRSVNSVDQMPENFKQWAKQNQDRIATAKSQPYFIRDNFGNKPVDEWFIKQPGAAKAPAVAPAAKPEVGRTPEQQFLHEFNLIKNPKTTPEQLLKTKEIKQIMDEGFGEDTAQWVEDYWARPANSKPKTYHRYDGAGEGVAGMGNGLYLGRDPNALNHFYNHWGERELNLSTFKGDPKWLDIMDPRREKLWDEFLKKKGINPRNSSELGEIVKKLGYDGIKYFDPHATGEEYVLFNTKLLKKVARAKLPEQRAAIQNAWDTRIAAKQAKIKPFELTDEAKERLHKKHPSINFRFEGGITKESYGKSMGGFNIEELTDELSDTFGKRGIEFTSFRMVEKPSEVMEIFIVGKTKDGDYIHLYRSFKKQGDKKIVLHNMFTVPLDLQGTGISKEVFKPLYKQYKAAGIKKIYVHANLDVGGYTWGKYGFIAPEDQALNIIKKAKRRLTKAQWDDAMITFNEWKASSQNSGKFPMRLLSDKKYGKRLLLETEWDGSIDLTDLAQRKTFENYLYAKKKAAKVIKTAEQKKAIQAAWDARKERMRKERIAKIAKERIAARSAGKKAEIQKAWDTRKAEARRKKIIEAAEKRHAARSQAQITAIQNRWEWNRINKMDANDPIAPVKINAKTIADYITAQRNSTGVTLSDKAAEILIIQVNEIRAKITPEFIAKAKAAGMKKEIIETVTVAKLSTTRLGAIEWRYKAIEEKIENWEKAQIAKKTKPKTLKFKPEDYSKERKDNALWTESQSTADAALRDKAGKTWISASEKEKIAAHNYTGNDYEPMNGYLRGKISPWFTGGEAALKEQVNNLTALLNRSELGTDIWLQRGVGLKQNLFGVDMGTISEDQAKKLFLNKTVTEKGFSSCSPAKGGGFSSDLLLNIYAPKGTKAIYAEPFSKFGKGGKLLWDGVSKQSSFSSEFEVILQQKTKFKVIKIEKNPYGQWFIDIEVIEQP